MNHSVNSDLFGCEYAEVQRNRARAIIALAAMPEKEIKRMTPMDYSAKNLTEDTVREYRLRECETTRAKLQLRTRCIALLQELGPQTTAEMGRALRVSSRAVALALREVQHIKEEKVRERAKYGRVADGIRWTLPATVAKAGAA